jgi:hypothetical protein
VSPCELEVARPTQGQPLGRLEGRPEDDGASGTAGDEMPDDDAGLGRGRHAAGFTDLPLPYEAALAALDLAVLHLEAGRTAEVKELAEAMGGIFKAKGITREALAALSCFCEAAQQGASQSHPGTSKTGPGAWKTCPGPLPHPLPAPRSPY